VRTDSPLPHQLGGLGSAVSPQRGPGRSPGRRRVFFCIMCRQIASLSLCWLTGIHLHLCVWLGGGANTWLPPSPCLHYSVGWEVVSSLLGRCKQKQRGLKWLLCRWPPITEWEMHITAHGLPSPQWPICVEWDVKLYYTIPYHTPSLWAGGTCRSVPPPPRNPPVPTPMPFVAGVKYTELKNFSIIAFLFRKRY